MSLCQAENGFSLGELVKKLADAFENKAFAEILKMNLQLTQEVLMHRIFNNLNSQQCCPGRAKIGMFGYIRGWLKWGLISPRAFSVIERIMRELGRRLKKTADKNRKNDIKKVYKCQRVRGLLAGKNELCRQCCRQHWQL